MKRHNMQKTKTIFIKLTACVFAMLLSVSLFATGTFAQSEIELTEENEIALDDSAEESPLEDVYEESAPEEEVFLLDSGDTAEAIPIEFGSVISGELTDEDADEYGVMRHRYSFTLEEAGRVYFHDTSRDGTDGLKPWIDLSPAFAYMYGHSITNHYVDLKAGTHILSVLFDDENGRLGDKPYHGSYSFILDFESAKSDFPDEQSNVQVHNVIDLDTTYNCQLDTEDTDNLDEDDDIEHWNLYEFTMPEDGTVDIEIEGWVPQNSYGVNQRVGKYLCNIREGSQIHRPFVYRDKLRNAKETISERHLLKKGTHTLSVTGNSGNFTLRVSRTKAKPVKAALNQDELTVRVWETLSDNGDYDAYTNTYDAIKASLEYSDGNQLQQNTAFTWKSGNKSIVTVDKYGHMKFLKCGTTRVVATAIENPDLQAVLKVNVRFEDVRDPSKYYYKPVYWAVKSGVIPSEIKFGPNKKITRNQFAVFLWNMAGCPSVTKAEEKAFLKKFPDAGTANRWLVWAAKKGILRGYKDGTLQIKNQITRKEAILMLYRYAGKPSVSGTLKFKDITSGKNSDTYKAILWATKNKITSGKTATTFSPDTLCTKAQLITFLYRYSCSK